MSVSGGLSKFKQAAKDLNLLWDETRIAWHDDNSRRFEEKFVARILSRLRDTDRALARMDAVVQEMRRDCE